MAQQSTRNSSSTNKLDKAILEDDDESELREKLKQKREQVTLFRSPLKTLYYFCIVVVNYVITTLQYMLTHKRILLASLFMIQHFAILYITPGIHQQYLGIFKYYFVLGAYWCFLGILSSVGLGSGLHTFVLYLGPHIARVTMAAYDCNSTDFDLYGENRFLCPSSSISSPNISTITGAMVASSMHSATLWNILMKVQFEGFMWGAGTAIGELPPYFVSRAARLANKKVEIEGIEVVVEDYASLTFVDKLKQKGQKLMFLILGRFGFIGILLFASVPNPLFDLAGIICGNFLVPFWTFFGATFIGKAVVKAHLQMCFVILAFHPILVQNLVAGIENVFPSSRAIIEQALLQQRSKLHSIDANSEQKNIIGILWDLCITAMVAYFVISIINSQVQEYLEQKDEERLKKNHKQ